MKLWGYWDRFSAVKGTVAIRTWVDLCFHSQQAHYSMLVKFANENCGWKWSSYGVSAEVLDDSPSGPKPDADCFSIKDRGVLKVLC